MKFIHIGRIKIITIKLFLLLEYFRKINANGKESTRQIPVTSKDTPYCITQALIDAAKGDWENGLFFCGANVGRIDRITTVRELMDELVTEWRNNR